MPPSENVLRQVSTLLSTRVANIEGASLLLVDQDLGHALYLLGQVPEASRKLIADIATELASLRRRAVTALGVGLWPEEKAQWVQQLDTVSGTLYTRTERLMATVQARAQAVNRTKQVKSQLREQPSWHDQLDVAKNVLLEGNKPKPAADESVDVDYIIKNDEDLRVPGDKTGAWDKDFRTLDEGRRFEQVTGLLGADAAYGVIHHPLMTILTGKASPQTQKRLSARGITVTTVMQHYTVVNNCRLLGVRNDLLPGRREFVMQVAASIFNRIQEEGKLTDYVMTRVPRRVRAGHTYFVLMPADAGLSIKEWDFNKVKPEDYPQEKV